MRSATTLLALLAFAGTLLLTSTTFAFEPSEDDLVQADRHMRNGYSFVSQRKYAAALREYRKGLDLMPGNMDLLYNLIAVANGSKSCSDVILYGTAFAGVAGRSMEMGEVRGFMDACTTTLEGKVGRIDVKGAPARSEIWVGGVYMGKAPLKDLTLPAGEWPVRVTLEDHEDWHGSATVSQEAAAEVSVSLVARIYTGYLQVKTDPPEGVSVYLDDKLVGVTPLGPIAMNTGKVLVRFELEGWDSWVRYVKIEREATEVLEATLERPEDQSAAN